jgi:fibronectin type 3 domain-containing protein
MKKFILSLILFFTFITVVFNATVDLAWDKPITTDTISGYNMYRSLNADGSSAAKLTATLIPTLTLTYSDSTASGGKTYYYYVTAMYGTTESVKSNIVQAVIPVAAPANLRIVP